MKKISWPLFLVLLFLYPAFVEARFVGNRVPIRERSDTPGTRPDINTIYNDNNALAVIDENGIIYYLTGSGSTEFASGVSVMGGVTVWDGSGNTVWSVDGAGNVMQEGNHSINGYATWNSATQYSTLLTNFTTAVSQYWNGSIAGNNMTITAIKAYIAGTSGVTDNTTYRIALHSKDDMDGSNELAAWTMNLPISGVSDQVGDLVASGVTVPLFNSSGLVKFDKVVIGTDSDSGTTEIQQVTATVGNIDTGRSGVTVTPLHNAWSTQASVSGLWEMRDMVMTRDEDSTSEIHISVEPLAAPGSGVSIYVIVEVM